MLLKQLLNVLWGFRGFPKIHHSFPFFTDFSSSKSEFTRLFQAFPSEKGVLQRYEQYCRLSFKIKKILYFGQKAADKP